MTHSLDTRASLEFIDIKVQAFTLDNSFSKSKSSLSDCGSVRCVNHSHVHPIAPSCSGLFVYGYISWLIT